MMSQTFDYTKMKNEFFSVGRPDQAGLPPGKVWKGTKIKSFEIVAKSKCIRCITINDVDEGSKSKRNCDVNKLKFRKGEFLEEIHCKIPRVPAKSKKANIVIHYIEFITNFKRKVCGGIPQVGKKESDSIVIKGKIAQIQFFFKGTGGTLKGLKIRIADPLDEEKITPEEEERLNFIIDEMGDFPITLRNRELMLWKSLVVRKETKINEVMLKNLDLDVDEVSILCFLLGKKLIEIENLKLIDYYVLFKYLGLEVEMMSVLDMSTKIDSFEDLYDVFQKCLSFEQILEDKLSSTTSSTSLEEPKIDEMELFQHSFTLKIFQKMKEKRCYLMTTGIQQEGFGKPLKTLMTFSGQAMSKRNGDLFSVDQRLENVMVLTSTYSSSHRNIYLHPDLSSFNSVSDPNNQSASSSSSLKQSYENHFRTLEEVKRKHFFKPSDHFNVILKTKEGKEVKCVLEYLIGKYEFFFHMISFGGMEVSDLKREGCITLMDLSKRELLLLLKYCCLNRIEESSIHILLSVYAHCEKYTDWKLMTVIGKEIEGIMKRNDNMTRKRMEKILYFSSEVLKMGHLKEKLIPILATASPELDEKEIKRMLKKEMKIFDLEKRVKELEGEVKELKEVNLELKKNKDGDNAGEEDENEGESSDSEDSDDS